MSDFKETSINYLNVDEAATFCSSEKKWINKILALHEKHPDKVQIVHYPEDNGGMIYAHLPKKWIKVPPPTRHYTEEQKAAMAERLAAAREKKGE